VKRTLPTHRLASNPSQISGFFDRELLHQAIQTAPASEIVKERNPSGRPRRTAPTGINPFSYRFSTGYGGRLGMRTGFFCDMMGFDVGLLKWL
jgi:hypothetical protein